MDVLAGLCSVTLRTRSIDEVARIAEGADLVAIEWGADVHVPPGDAAAVAAARAASAGCEQVSYGSYLLAARHDVSDDEIAVVLDTAAALGARNVRVWCPFGVEPASDRRSGVIERLAAVAGAAADRGLTIGLEYHGGTLTATAASAAGVVDAVGHENLFTYWQPPYWLEGRSIADDVSDVEMLGARVSHLHVYEWRHAPAVTRRPLVAGEARWRAVLGALECSTGAVSPRVAFCEFVVDDDPELLADDARTLRSWLGPAG